MDKIEYKNIDFKQLHRLKRVHAKNSKIYIDKNNEYLFKVFNDMKKDELNNKMKKIEIFSNVESENIICPEYMINKKNKLKGHVTKYIESETLYDLRCKIDFLSYLKILINSSKNLEEFHKIDGKPIFGDLHFGNIIVDDNMNSYFVDIDSCGINNLPCDDTSAELAAYLKFLSFDCNQSQELDKLSFMLSTFRMIFGRNVLSIGEYTFDYYCDQYNILKDLKDIFKKLNRPGNEIPSVPYLYELIKR